MDTGARLGIIWLNFDLVPMVIAQFYHNSSSACCHPSILRHLQYNLSNNKQELESQKEHLICEAGNHLQRNDMQDQIDARMNTANFLIPYVACLTHQSRGKLAKPIKASPPPSLSRSSLSLTLCPSVSLSLSASACLSVCLLVSL